MGTPRVTRSGVAADHAAVAAHDPAALVATMLRTKSVHAREILAPLVWPGRDLPALRHWWGSRPATLHPDMDPAWAGRLATVLCLQTGSPLDLMDGMAVFAGIEGSQALDQVDPRDLEVLLQLRLVRGDRAGVGQVMGMPGLRESVVRAVQADLANPLQFPEHGDWEEWHRAFQAVLGGSAAPVELRGSGTTAFDRLSARVPPVDEPGRVTVLMSAYRPGPPLLTAVRSVLEQSWVNLELLLVDDASGPDFSELLESVARTDPRVRLIRKVVNGGTYRARNTALRLATGDFFVVVDSDDWVHPQLLERSVRALQDDPRAPAVRSLGLRRVSESLRITRPGYSPRGMVASSLTARMEVVSRVGLFDTTRKGADSEYARRIEAAYGVRIRTVREVLTFVRGDDGSLSAAEYSRGWRHPARHEYRCAYEFWHDSVARGESDPYLDPEQPRRFPQPVRWQERQRAGLDLTEHLDVVFAGDWRPSGARQRTMLDEVAACHAVGLRVGVMHLESFLGMTERDLPLNPAVTEWIGDSRVRVVHPDDDVDIDVLLVRPPSILLYPPALGRHPRVGRLLLVTDEPPVRRDGSDPRYPVADITERARQLLGAEPEWVPGDAATRRLLLRQDPDVWVVDWDHPVVIDVPGWRTRRMPAVDRPLRPEAVVDYPVDVAGHHPRALLQHSDFVVVTDPPEVPCSDRIMLEAAASGALAIAHPRHRDTYGDAFVYAAPDQVAQVVSRYAGDPVGYDEQVEQALAHVERTFGAHDLARRILTMSRGTRSRALPVSRTLTSWWPAAEPLSKDHLVVEVPLRGAADGERSDEAALVLGASRGVGSTEAFRRTEVATWLARILREQPDPAVPDCLTQSPPMAVEAVLVARDQFVEGAVRAGSPLVAQCQEPRGAGSPRTLRPPPGWVATSWWRTRPGALDASAGHR